MKRFNKTQLIHDLYGRAARIQNTHGFTRDNGYAQVMGKGEEENRAYGEWQTLENLARDIEAGYIGVKSNDKI